MFGLAKHGQQSNEENWAGESYKRFSTYAMGPEGHPRGLFYLAFTEAWERFSY